MPLVQRIGTARPLAFAKPRAKKAAVLSSMRVCSFIKPFCDAAKNAKLSGALRDPGEITTSVIPASIIWRTMTRARDVESLTNATPSR